MGTTTTAIITMKRTVRCCTMCHKQIALKVLYAASAAAAAATTQRYSMLKLLFQLMKLTRQMFLFPTNGVYSHTHTHIDPPIGINSNTRYLTQFFKPIGKVYAVLGPSIRSGAELPSCTRMVLDGV